MEERVGVRRPVHGPPGLPATSLLTQSLHADVEERACGLASAARTSKLQALKPNPHRL